MFAILLAFHFPILLSLPAAHNEQDFISQISTANDLIANGRYLEAAEGFEKLMREVPETHAQACALGRARALAGMGKYVASLSVLYDLRNAQGDVDESVAFLLSDVYMRAERLHAAEYVLRRYLNSSDNVDVARLLAENYARFSRLALAEESLGQLRASENVDVLRIRGIIELRKREYDAAIKSFSSVVKEQENALGNKHPDLIHTAFFLAEAYVNKGDAVNAKITAQRIQNLLQVNNFAEHPWRATLLELRAGILSLEGQVQEAYDLSLDAAKVRGSLISELIEFHAVAIKTTSAARFEHTLFLRRIASELGENTLARQLSLLAIYWAYLSDDPKSADLIRLGHILTGDSYITLGKPKAAIPHYERALELSSKTEFLVTESELEQGFGNAYALAGKFTSAEQHLRKAIDLAEDPISRASATYDLAYLYHHNTHQLEESRALCENAIRVLTERFGAAHPETLKMSIASATVALAMGDLEAAGREASAALAVARQSVPLQSRAHVDTLAEIYGILEHTSADIDLDRIDQELDALDKHSYWPADIPRQEARKALADAHSASSDEICLQLSQGELETRVPFSLQFDLFADAVRDARLRSDLDLMVAYLLELHQNTMDHNRLVIQNHDPKDALAHVLSHQLNNVYLVADILHSLGLYSRSGDLLGNVLETLDSTVNERAAVRARLLRRAGEVYELRGELAKASSSLSASVEVLEGQAEVGVELAQLYTMQARIAIRLNSFADGKRFLKAAWKLRQSLGSDVDPAGLASTYEVTGDLHWKYLEYDTAIEAYEFAHDSFRRYLGEYDDSSLRVLLKIAGIYVDSGRNDDAAKHLQHYAKLTEQRGSTHARDQVEFAYWWGRQHIARGPLSFAHDSLKMASDFILNPLAGFDGEIVQFAQGLAADFPSPYQIVRAAQIELARGELEWRRQRFFLALDHYETAERFLTENLETQRPADTVRIRLALGGGFRELGQYSRSDHILHDCLNQIDTYFDGDHPLRVALLLERALTASARRDSVSAARYAEEGLEAARKMLSHDHWLAGDLRSMRAAQHLRNADLDSAGPYLEDMLGLLDSMHNGLTPDVRPRDSHLMAVSAFLEFQYFDESLSATASKFAGVLEQLVSARFGSHLVHFQSNDPLQGTMMDVTGPPRRELAEYLLTLAKLQCGTQSESLLQRCRMARIVNSLFIDGALRALPPAAQLQFMASEYRIQHDLAISLLLSTKQSTPETILEALSWSLSSKGVATQTMADRLKSGRDTCASILPLIEQVIEFTKADQKLVSEAQGPEVAPHMAMYYEKTLDSLTLTRDRVRELDELTQKRGKIMDEISHLVCRAWQHALDEPASEIAMLLKAESSERTFQRFAVLNEAIIPDLNTLRQSSRITIDTIEKSQEMDQGGDISDDLNARNSKRIATHKAIVQLIDELQLPERKAHERVEVDPKSVREHLPANSVLVEFVRYGQWNCDAPKRSQEWNAARYAAFVVPPSGIDDVRYIDLGEASVIDQAVRAFRSACSDPSKNWISPGLQLRKMIWEPIEPALRESSDVVLCPDGDLWLVPWAALPGKKANEFLIHERSLSYVVSGRQIVEDRGVVQGEGFAIFADPHLAPGAWSAQPRTRLLATAVSDSIAQKLGVSATQIPNSLFLGTDASEARFRAVKRPRLLMFCTHAFFGLPQRPQRPLDFDPFALSGFVLSGANKNHTSKGDDGIVLAVELRDRDLRGTEVAVLGGCETGVGAVEAGEGVLGLRQAFHRSGVRFVVGSLWKVDVNHTVRLLDRFLDGIKFGSSGIHYAKALRRAQLDLIETSAGSDAAALSIQRLGAGGAIFLDPIELKKAEQRLRLLHPFYWAAFALTGRP